MHAARVSGLSLLAYLADLGRLVEDRVRRFVEEHRPRWVYVMFSGGKDSSAALAAAASCCRDLVVAVFVHVVGQTHWLNAGAALGVAARLGLRVRRLVPRSPVELRLALAREPPRPPEMLYIVARSYRYGLDYWSAVERWGLPVPVERGGGGIRWCCSEFKEKWLGELPASGAYRGRPARFVIVGVKASDSPFRARRWRGRLVDVVDGRGMPNVVLAPLADLSDADVWELLRRYGVYDIVRRQYDVMGQSPNCVLCPFMPLDVAERTVRVLPTPYLRRVLAALRRAARRGGFQARRVAELAAIIEGELGRRGEGVGG